MVYGCLRQSGRILLLVSVLLVPFLLIASAVRAQERTQQFVNDDSTQLAAMIYLTTSTLRPMFEDNLKQQVPTAFEQTINNMVGKLPDSDQDWARQMAQTLLQPSTSLTEFKPQDDGVLTSVRLKLYPNDPKPIDSSMLIKFSKQDDSTIQVSAQAIPNKPALMKGNLTTFHIPVGKLTSVKTTATCNDAALGLGLNIGLSLTAQQQEPRGLNAPPKTMPAFVEIPKTSLAQLGTSMGTMQVSQHLSANNIQVGVQGKNLLVTADILFDGSIKLGVARTLIEPQAKEGNLAVHVVKTEITVFQVFTFPNNAYNTQVEQSLNDRLSKALAGKFSVDEAHIGSTAQLPCVAADSLLLAGSTRIG
jgi:hypothetical protein